MSDTFQSLFLDHAARKHYHATPENAVNSNIQVMVWPTFSGLTEFEKEIADKIASLGYTATAVDLYGSNCQLDTIEEKVSVMGVLLEKEQPLHDLQRQLIAQVNDSFVDNDDAKTAIVHVGFCLGGRLALEAGVHFKESVGAASYHGLMSFYRASEALANRDVRIMVLNGYSDHMVSDGDAQSAKQYWNDLGIDFQFMDFGNTYHSFMLPTANSPERGSIYNSTVAKRGYQYLEHFLSEF